MLLQVRWLVGFAAVASLVAAAPALAQSSMMAPARTHFIAPPRDEQPVDALPDVYSSVSLIDSSLTRNNLRMRLDFNNRFRRPTMAEYFQPKGGLPVSPGPPRPETNVDYQEWITTLEYAPDTWLSVFLETPLRWVNPDQNANTSGAGDLDLGFKVGIFTDARFLATFQLKLYVPTAANSALGTEHVSIEPGILAAYRLADMFQLEGELRYWASLGGTDFAGDFLRYGLGLSYGQPGGDVIWITPVVEVVGWSIFDGKALAVAPGFLGIENLAGQTIVNAQAGVRVGLGHSADFYAGYNRALTGPAWYRDMVRVEFRWHY